MKTMLSRVLALLGSPAMSSMERKLMSQPADFMMTNKGTIIRIHKSPNGKPAKVVAKQKRAAKKRKARKARSPK